jgi:hypothetical protein
LIPVGGSLAVFRFFGDKTIGVSASRIADLPGLADWPLTWHDKSGVQIPTLGAHFSGRAIP